jgi:hypothetical protein
MTLYLIAQAATPQEIDDIQPPIAPDTAIWWVVAIAIALVLALIAYFFWPEKLRRHQPPPLPKATALSRLEQLRHRLEELDVFQLAVETSAVLRAFIEEQFGIRAVHQTTPEFLVSASHHPRFNSHQRDMLQEFLERCDAIKFARVAAGPEEGENLFSQACKFVEEA